MDIFHCQAFRLAVLNQADTIITIVLKPEQFAKVQFLNDKVDKNTNSTTRRPKRYCLSNFKDSHLEIAQVLAKADALGIILSA